MSRKVSRDLRRGIDLGVQLGLAAAAGLAGECDLTGRKLATLLDAFANDMHASAALSKVAVEQALKGVAPTPADFRDALATLMIGVRRGAKA